MRRQKVAFEPLETGKVSMYVCGPTPYAPAHIGHAYSAIAFDTIRRSLRFLGYDVKFVRNITDVEDKIIKRANELAEDPMALADRFAADYNRDMARFGVLAPDIEPKVSAHMADIIGVIEKLIANRCAYPVDGDVYFSVESFPPYGKLSGQSLEELRDGARVAIDERKRAPADFALWKAAKPGEPAWDSPWGKGRPGWHIECSAMTVAHLGETFDLHGGGKDLIFPHHENEIAQSQGAYGAHTFARYWLHNGFLNFAGEKMSKSLGNVFGCDQIAAAVGGEALRFFCVSHHYRSPVDFDVEEIRAPDGTPTGVRFRSLEAADRQLGYFYTTLHKLDQFVAQGGDGGAGAVLPDAERLVGETRDALADDFNAPVVMAAMHAAATLANKLVDEGKGIDKALRRRTIARLAADLRLVGSALGILAGDPKVYLAGRRDRLVRQRGIDVARVEQLLRDRVTARAAKDFQRADAIRGELTALGVVVEDTPQGSDWRVIDDGNVASEGQGASRT
ncbi:MAG: cysteinyl-tRNA synthetase [Deltaproteobacteria bacterium]|nr:cysteinyl-tRNA synthetase [Deltaproteobacteria bacterium]